MNMKTMNQAQFTENQGVITLQAKAKSDFIVSPDTKQITANAAFIYEEVQGDFILQARVRHSFTSTYDAAALFAYESDNLWAKAAYECSDFGTKTVVSVMTNKVSDDANGVNLTQDYVWLQLLRKGDVFAVHYSLDGEYYELSRVCSLPLADTLKVGFVAQCPLGKGSVMEFSAIQMMHKTVTDIRKGK